VAFGREPMRDRKGRAETYAQIVTLMANSYPVLTPALRFDTVMAGP
jgi:hypothetical protein